MEVTTTEAALRLGVSVRQAQRLARSGRLQAVRRVGRSNVLDDSAIVAASNARRGRVWLARTAWAAIDLLENGTTERLDGSALSRLRARLRTCDADELVRLAGRRADLWRGSQSRRTTDALRGEIALSGESLLATADIARKVGLVTVDSDRVEGYVHTTDWDRVQSRFGLEPDANGAVLIHRTEQSTNVGVICTALDLAERWSVRERSAAIALLDERLRSLR